MRCLPLLLSGGLLARACLVRTWHLYTSAYNCTLTVLVQLRGFIRHLVSCPSVLLLVELRLLFFCILPTCRAR